MTIDWKQRDADLKSGNPVKIQAVAETIVTETRDRLRDRYTKNAVILARVNSDEWFNRQVAIIIDRYKK